MQEQEVICQFIAGLIKTVMCRKLLGPQSMHFDLKSQIKSHRTRGGPHLLPRLKTEAADLLCQPHWTWVSLLQDRQTHLSWETSPQVSQPNRGLLGKGTMSWTAQSALGGERLKSQALNSADPPSRLLGRSPTEDLCSSYPSLAVPETGRGWKEDRSLLFSSYAPSSLPSTHSLPAPISQVSATAF